MEDKYPNSLFTPIIRCIISINILPFVFFAWVASQIGEQNIGLALQRCELLLCRPRGRCMTKEVRTNTFTSSEPLHTASSACVLRTQPPANTPCDTIDTDYRFCLLKNMLCGPWKCQERHPGSKIYWEFIDQAKLLFKKGEGGEGSCGAGSSECNQCFLFHPRARTYIRQICIHVYLYRSNLTSSCWHDSKRNTSQCFSCN